MAGARRLGFGRAAQPRKRHRVEQGGEQDDEQRGRDERGQDDGEHGFCVS
ncbi:MAG: hypothetical protein IPO91_09775 [Chloroflexi bacterium]|nr:hypothetical protein [Chloroflexota bacterium]